MPVYCKFDFSDLRERKLCLMIGARGGDEWKIGHQKTSLPYFWKLFTQKSFIFPNSKKVLINYFLRKYSTLVYYDVYSSRKSLLVDYESKTQKFGWAW